MKTKRNIVIPLKTRVRDENFTGTRRFTVTVPDSVVKTTTRAGQLTFKTHIITEEVPT